MSHYAHLSIEEREMSRCLLEKGSSILAIASILGFSTYTNLHVFEHN